MLAADHHHRELYSFHNHHDYQLQPFLLTTTTSMDQDDHHRQHDDHFIFPDKNKKNKIISNRSSSRCSESKKKRFTDEQIKSLELIFKNESKLDPKKKVQVARELGLHPRQVAIWFQNKRARWKSKQLEVDYSILRDDYTDLLAKFETLRKEKKTLVAQLVKLKATVQRKHQGGAAKCKDIAVPENSNRDQVSESGNNNTSSTTSATKDEEDEIKSRMRLLSSNTITLEKNDHPRSYNVRILSEEGCTQIINTTTTTAALESSNNYYTEEEEMELLTMVQDPTACCSSLTTSADEDWHSTIHSADGLFDQSAASSTCGGDQWWDFWS